jgi:hypothetical protein
MACLFNFFIIFLNKTDVGVCHFFFLDEEG